MGYFALIFVACGTVVIEQKGSIEIVTNNKDKISVKDKIIFFLFFSFLLTIPYMFFNSSFVIKSSNSKLYSFKMLFKSSNVGYALPCSHLAIKL